MRKKLLLLSPYFPYPARDGGKVRLYNLIRQLSASCDIYFLSFIESLSMREFVPELEKYCVCVHTVLRDEHRRVVVDAIPRSPGFYYTPEMIEAVEHAVASFKPDVVHIEFLNMTPYRHHIGGVPVIYTEHDMSSTDFDQSFHDRDMSEKDRFVEWTKLIEYQKRIVATFDAIVVLTERDRALLDAFVPGLRLFCVPTGVDIEHFSYEPSFPDEPRLVFVGHYKHFPNLDAVHHFVADVFPRIVAAVPDVTFDIVGSGLPRDVRALEHPRIRIVGEVADVRPSIRAAMLFVAPVRLGGGIKGKILEAMALGTPVVASTEAGEGIQCRDGWDIAIAPDDAAFSRMTIHLIHDAQARAAIARQARRLVEREYDWRILGRALDKVYDAAVTSRPS